MATRRGAAAAGCTGDWMRSIEHRRDRGCQNIDPMSKQAKGAFEIAGWEEATYSQREAGPKLTRSTIAHKITGDVVGDGKLEYLMIYFDERTTRFIGYEQITGELGGRAGSFVVHHEGTYDNGVAKIALQVVPGSGTGELRGLRGSGGLEATDARTSSFTLDYSFA
jgi:hypothetical protein